MAVQQPPAGRLTGPRYRRPLGGDRGTWIQYATTIATAVLVLGPIVPILYQSFVDRPLYASGAAFEWRNYAELFSQAGFGDVIVNSLLFAALTTVLAVVIGVVLAILTVRTKMLGAGVVSTVLLWPIYLSPLVLAFAWIIVYGPSGYMTIAFRTLLGTEPWNLYTIPGMAITAAAAYTPLAYLYCSGALKLADPAIEDAARVCGAGPLSILRKVTLPLLRPPILYGAVLIFSSSLELLSIPLLLGRPVNIDMFASFLYVYGLEQTNPDYGVLGAASMVLLAFMGILVLIQLRLLRNAQRFVSVRGKATRHQLLDLGWLRWVGFGFAWLYVLLGPVLPILALLLRSVTLILSPLVSPWTVLSLENFRTIFGYSAYVSSIVNSVVIATVGAVATTLFASFVVLVARRSQFRFRQPLQVVALAPQALPGIIIGLGFFWFFAYVEPLNVVRGTLLAIIIAFACRALPLAFGAIAPLVTQVADELDDSARTVGADWLYTVSRVLFRLFVPAFFSSFALIFVQMMKEFAPALFLVTANTQIFGTTNLQLWLNGNTGAVAALSVVQIAITAVFVLLASRILKVRFHA